MDTRIEPHQIKALRRRLGLTQEQLAGMLGVSLGAVPKWEAGAWKPSGDRAAELRRLMAEAPPAVTVDATVNTYDQAIAAWEQERAERIAAGESSGAADSILRLLRATRTGILAVKTDD